MLIVVNGSGSNQFLLYSYFSLLPLSKSREFVLRHFLVYIYSSLIIRLKGWIPRALKVALWQFNDGRR